VKKEEIIRIISSCGLKVTPQRIAVLDAVISLTNHPTAENIIGYIKVNHPNIATGTVYKTLETFTAKGILSRVKTGDDIMRYDAVMIKHHHLYCIESDRIEDYYDDELNNLLEIYFKSKKIPSFNIEDIRLQIIGRFLDN
jgi:Fur family peroxide stress response transcriptional regulator